MSVLKEMFSRKRILPIVLIAVLFYVWKSRQPEPLVSIQGTTFGSIAWHVKYKDSEARNLTASVDSLLVEFNAALSHYDPNSDLSKFNKDSVFTFESPLFLPVLQESRRIYNLSEGAFNPAVMPLVNFWGFGPEQGSEPDSSAVDSLLQFTDFNMVHFDENSVWKDDPRTQLDFSAVAKGYAVDQVALFLEGKGIENYFVEIGGEVRARGTNAGDKPWRIGIIDPASDILNQSFIATVDLDNMSLATSANNFNYVVKNGIRYAHTLNPKTGYPTELAILSASVFAEDCMTADALATAFMASGVEASKAILEKDNTIEALLIYSNDSGEVLTYATKGINPAIYYLNSDK